MSMPEEERSARAAISDHSFRCSRCRSGDAGCPEAEALYRTWRSAWRPAWPLDDEVSRANGHV